MSERNERLDRNLASAIATMRHACDEAERRAKSGDAFAVQMVLHSLMWGMANASSSLENAMSALEDAHALRGRDG